VKKYIASALGICTLAIVLLVSCNKINQATDMGQDLIPPVDNIHTFDTTLEVETYNMLSAFADDSARSIYSDDQYLGVMTDPIFGKTDARMFFQLTPANGKTNLLNVPGKRYIDSVVLQVAYLSTYGDTTTPQTITVSELSTANNFKVSGTNRDSAYSIREDNFITTNILGSRQIIPRSLKDSSIDIRAKDTARIGNALRIRLSNSFGQRLLDYDTTGVNDGYSTDSIFLTKMGGFALKSTSGGNSIMGFNIADNVNTRLIVYYRHDNTTTAGDIDTAVAYYNIVGRVGTANYIGRDHNGTLVQSTSNDNTKDPIAYIQNSPGAYTKVKIPGLAGMTNRVIHLAQLQMEQVYDPADTLFNAPRLMFMDMLDATNNKYKTIPYAIENGSFQAANDLGTVLSITPAGYISFGSGYTFKKDLSNNTIKEWKFNLTRYAQYVVKGMTPLADLRLHANYYTVINNGNVNSNSTRVIVQIGSGPAAGRVRLGGGNHPTQKMKLRIVYSKI
jgi:hypothetical protein